MLLEYLGQAGVNGDVNIINDFFFSTNSNNKEFNTKQSFDEAINNSNNKNNNNDNDKPTNTTKTEEEIKETYILYQTNKQKENSTIFQENK
eukprot:c21420_g5_i1.p1 GENE.c21420_g5_i1~~c21420_g5_i1.p1  ORF type:complete len:103 (+),score=29.39 c21420_g5_i1:37-309(+)